MTNLCDCGCERPDCMAIQNEGGLCPSCGCFLEETPAQLERRLAREAADEEAATRWLAARGVILAD